MIYFLYGPDTYQLKEKLEEIIRQYNKTYKGRLNLRLLDLEKNNFDDFFDKAQQVSMFSLQNIAILRNSLRNTAFKTEFLNQKKDFLGPDKVVIFCEDGELPKEDSFVKFLKKSR
jgi:DNA polymerase III delta subunit